MILRVSTLIKCRRNVAAFKVLTKVMGTMKGRRRRRGKEMMEEKKEGEEDEQEEEEKQCQK